MKQLRPAQIETLKKHIANLRFLDRSHAGTGKTAPACVYSRYVVANLGKKVIWIQPTSLSHKNWEELREWTGLGARIVEMTGSATKKAAIAIRRDIDIWLMTPEALKTYGKQMFSQHDIGAIICDEPHMYYVGFESARTQAFYNIVNCKRYKDNLAVKFLTASPTPKGRLTAAYIYCAVIQFDYYRGFNFFKATHMQDDGFGTIEWVNAPVLHRFLMHYSVCHTTKDVHGDVEVVTIRHQMDLLPKHKKLYDQFQAKGVIDLMDTIHQDTQPSGNVLRARQILNHPHSVSLPIEWDSDNKPIAFQELKVFEGLTPKEEALINYANEGEPLFVIATFHVEQVRLVETLRKHTNCVVEMINGTVSKPERDRIDAGFRNGTIDVVVVASGRTTGVGYNWQHINTIIFHSLDYGDDVYYQAIRRAIRGAREQPLRVILLEYKNTMDAYLMLRIHQASIRSNSVNPDFAVITFPKLGDAEAENSELWD